MKPKFLPLPRPCASLRSAARSWPTAAKTIRRTHYRPRQPSQRRAFPSPKPFSARRLPDGSLFVPKAVQRQLGLRHVIVAVGELAATVELNGTVVADPNAGGRVQATQVGRIEVAAGGLPTLGQKVTRGQLLALLHPVVSSINARTSRRSSTKWRRYSPSPNAGATATSSWRAAFRVRPSRPRASRRKG